MNMFFSACCSANERRRPVHPDGIVSASVVTQCKHPPARPPDVMLPYRALDWLRVHPRDDKEEEQACRILTMRWEQWQSVASLTRNVVQHRLLARGERGGTQCAQIINSLVAGGGH